MQAIAWIYQVGLTTVHCIIQEVCKAIWEALALTYVKPPDTEEEWLKISQEFNNKWNFPNCLGALDGKHINIQAPRNSGSQYYNYKKNFSIVLLASCDADYNFTLVDIGAYGSQSDGGIFSNSHFGIGLDRGELNLPGDRCLPGSNLKSPHCFVADEAFPLRNYIMRPYARRGLTHQQRIFNYRLSRARRMIENTFGILAARWRILRGPIFADVDNVDNIVKALVCLHNFINKESSKCGFNRYNPAGFADCGDLEDGEWRKLANTLKSVGQLSSNHSSRVSGQVRDQLANYFCSPSGETPWQYECVFGDIL